MNEDKIDEALKSLSSISYFLNKVTKELETMNGHLDHIQYRMKKQSLPITEEQYEEVKAISNSWWSNKT